MEEGNARQEPCTHPELVYFFSVMKNCYIFACKECLQTLQISAYEIVKFTRREWREHIIRLVAENFGDEWANKAREWLEQTEDKIK